MKEEALDRSVWRTRVGRGFGPVVRAENEYIYIYIYGSTVVKVLCYKSEGRWFDPSWCHWKFSLT